MPGGAGQGQYLRLALAMEKFDLFETAARIGMFFVPFLFALCFHEFAHGWVARMKGDRTAEIMGRLTLNPFAHADPIGTFVLPIFSMISHIPVLGWAKPVPVDPRNLKRPKQDMFWIAAAGPLSNIFLALVGTILLTLMMKFMPEEVQIRGHSANAGVNMLAVFVTVNMALAFLNLIPIHPLDGGKILARFIPDAWNRKLEDMQGTMSIVLFLVFSMGGFEIVSRPAGWVTSFLFLFAERMAA